MKYLFLSLFLMAGLAGCSDKESTTLVTYDLLNIKENTELRFSDMVNDIKIVPIETTQDVLIPDCQYIIDQHYIITLDQNAVHQFDLQTGKHLRKLAVAGNGPNEFVYINAAFARNGKLYFRSRGKDYFSVIDLASGEPLDKLETHKPVEADFMGMAANGEFYIRNDSLLFEIFDPHTKRSRFLIDTTMKKEIKKKDHITFLSSIELLGGKSIAQYMSQTYLYNSTFSDTLYLQKDITSNVVPFAAFILPKAKTGAQSDLGIPDIDRIDLSFPYADSQRYLGVVSNLVCRASGNSITLKINYDGVYYIDKETDIARKITKYIFDPLFVKEFDNQAENGSVFSGIFSGHNAYVDDKIYAKVLPAYEVKTAIEKSLEDPDLPAEKRTRLLELDNKLTEDSNPVVFFGQKR